MLKQQMYYEAKVKGAMFVHNYFANRLAEESKIWYENIHTHKVEKMPGCKDPNYRPLKLGIWTKPTASGKCFYLASDKDKLIEAKHTDVLTAIAINKYKRRKPAMEPSSPHYIAPLHCRVPVHSNARWRHSRHVFIKDDHPLDTLTKEAYSRISQDATWNLPGRLMLPGELQVHIDERIKFAKQSVAESFDELLLLSRYQRNFVTLGNRLIELLDEDENFQIFEKKALDKLKKGELIYQDFVGFGGDRGSLAGLCFPMPSSAKTWAVTTNELTWVVRNVLMTAKRESLLGNRFEVDYSFTDDLDLKADWKNRSTSYNVITTITGGVYHDMLGNSYPKIYAHWKKIYF